MEGGDDISTPEILQRLCKHKQTDPEELCSLFPEHGGWGGGAEKNWMPFQNEIPYFRKTVTMGDAVSPRILFITKHIN